MEISVSPRRCSLGTNVHVYRSCLLTKLSRTKSCTTVYCREQRRGAAEISMGIYINEPVNWSFSCLQSQWNRSLFPKIHVTVLFLTRKGSILFLTPKGSVSFLK